MKLLRISLLTVIVTLVYHFAYAEYLLVGNNSVPEEAISKSDLELIFMGKMNKWSDGTWIRPALMMGKSETREIFLTYIDKNISTYMKYWREKVMTGTGIPPKSLQSEVELAEYIAKTEGAIGLISSDTPHENLKIMKLKE